VEELIEEVTRPRGQGVGVGGGDKGSRGSGSRGNSPEVGMQPWGEEDCGDQAVLQQRQSPQL
jgi:hypothetical protein